MCNFLIKIGMVKRTIYAISVLVLKLWIINAFKSCAHTAYIILIQYLYGMGFSLIEKQI